MHLGDAGLGRDLRLGHVVEEAHEQDPALPLGKPDDQAAQRLPLLHALQQRIGRPVTIKVADQVRLEFDRSAIGRIVPAQGEGGSTS